MQSVHPQQHPVTEGVESTRNTIWLVLTEGAGLRGTPFDWCSVFHLSSFFLSLIFICSSFCSLVCLIIWFSFCLFTYWLIYSFIYLFLQLFINFHYLFRLFILLCIWSFFLFCSIVHSCNLFSNYLIFHLFFPVVYSFFSFNLCFFAHFIYYYFKCYFFLFIPLFVYFILFFICLFSFLWLFSIHSFIYSFIHSSILWSFFLFCHISLLSLLCYIFPQCFMVILLFGRHYSINNTKHEWTLMVSIALILSFSRSDWVAVVVDKSMMEHLPSFSKQRHANVFSSSSHFLCCSSQ